MLADIMGVLVAVGIALGLGVVLLLWLGHSKRSAVGGRRAKQDTHAWDEGVADRAGGSGDAPGVDED